MISSIEVNWLTILCAGVASFIVGAIWYSVLFGKTWAKLQGVKMGSGKGTGKLYVINFVAGLVTAYVLVHALRYAGASTVLDALVVGFWNWLGFFAVTTLLGSVLWEGKSAKLFCINAGYWLVNLWVMSLILTLWS